MTQALGLEGLATPDLLEIYKAIVEAVDAVTAGGEVPQRGHLAFEALRDAVVVTIHSSPDSLPALVRSGSDLTDDEIASNIAVLLFGGVVTSEATIASVLFHVLGDESTRDQVTADRSLVRGAVEEAIRIEPAAAVVDRYATRAISVGGARIRQSNLVRVSLTAAGRDPLVFADPDRFDMKRANSGKHLGFARGPHACLGMHLARLEARAALDAVLSALPGVGLDGANTTPPEGLIFRGPERVTATWTPR
jgi:cytochrome P450